MNTRQRWSNWWWYHRRPVLLGLVAAAIVVYFIVQDRTVEQPDYHVALVCGKRLSEAELKRVSRSLAAWGSDRNGDGRVKVMLHAYRLDLSEPELSAERNTVADYTGLETDFMAAQSGIFLMEDPASFQAELGALGYLDGSVPSAGAQDVENMAVPWERLSGEPLSVPLWAGFRAVWDEKTAEKLASDRALWEALLAAAGMDILK